MARTLTVEDLLAIGGPRAKRSVCQGIIDNLSWLDKWGISAPHRLAHFLGQTGEESDHFATLREYASGKEYEGRKDLGNTRPGDGVRYAGRCPIQLTGRYNYQRFTAWLRKIMPNCPDFEQQPALVQTYPWALYAAVFYWVGHNLNRLADDNNIIPLTKAINGGLRGLDERIRMTVRASLILLGYKADELKKFQTQKQVEGGADGVPGKYTFVALDKALRELEMAPSPTGNATPTVAIEVEPELKPELNPERPEPAKPIPVSTVQSPPTKPDNFWVWLAKFVIGLSK